MLVITRKKEESLLIGDDIEIKIVKIAIDAPKDKIILRKEVYENVRKENTKAVANTNEILKLLK